MSMSRPGAQTARVGFLVFVALAILVATIMSLGGEQKFWERKVQYEVHFARTNGLQVGAPVSLTGVTIGSVAEMRFPPDPTASYIQVLVNVLGDATPRIHENSVATIRTFGLLGDRYVELSAGSPDSPPLPAGGLISSIDPVDYEAVLGQSGDIVTNVVEVTASLKVVLQAIERGEGLLGTLVNDPSLYHEAKALVGGARRSWLLGVYKGFSGLWPFGGGGAEAPPAQALGKPPER